jgi:hypothetical protein
VHSAPFLSGLIRKPNGPMAHAQLFDCGYESGDETQIVVPPARFQRATFRLGVAFRGLPISQFTESLREIAMHTVHFYAGFDVFVSY